jgi:short-subunit dehydrogenase
MINPPGNSDQFRMHYGPWALIAGASHGLGAEYAKQIAARGVNVVIVARHADELAVLGQSIEQAYGVEVRTLVLDLAQAENVTTLIQQTADLEIGLLVYNAAFSAVGGFIDRPIGDHLRELAVNCRGPLVLSHVLGRAMCRRHHGGVLLMSSLSSAQGSALIANYAATKSYNLLLAEGLWDEMRTQGVDVLACCAGTMATPNYLASQPRPTRLNAIPPMSPRDVAAQALVALGQGPSTIPGRGNKFAAFFMRHLLPRRTAIEIMGRTMRSMYS